MELEKNKFCDENSPLKPYHFMVERNDSEKEVLNANYFALGIYCFWI